MYQSEEKEKSVYLILVNPKTCYRHSWKLLNQRGQIYERSATYVGEMKTVKLITVDCVLKAYTILCWYHRFKFKSVLVL